MLNAPFASVVIGEPNSAVGAEPLPPVPAAYNCTLAPAIDRAPARTNPLTLAIASFFVGAG
jgi:hypothetical protein